MSEQRPSEECFYCHETMAYLERCEECQNLFCDDCAPYREDDSPITLCMTCCVVENSESKLRDRKNNALAYIDRILANNPNGAELMFLRTVKQILAGADDGRRSGEGGGDER